MPAMRMFLVQHSTIESVSIRVGLEGLMLQNRFSDDQKQFGNQVSSQKQRLLSRTLSKVKDFQQNRGRMVVKVHKCQE